MAREAEDQAILVKAAEEAEMYYTELERAKWIECVDEFHDRTYWQHNETGKIIYNEPQLEDCIYVPRIRLLPTV